MIEKNIYLMSDLHGHYDLFMMMLEKIKFSEDDELFILGDIIDRGPKSLELIRYVMKHRKNIHLLKGNHEDMCVDASKEDFFSSCYDTRLWFSNGGFETFKQFRRLEEEEIKEMIDFFKNLPLQVNLELDKTYILSHAHYSKNPREMLWFRPTLDVLKRASNRLPENTEVFFGHTAVQHFRPAETSVFLRVGKFTDLDCSLAYNNKYSQLGCLNLKDRKEYYIPLSEEKKGKYNENS